MTINLRIQQQNAIRLIGIDRPAARNAVDGATAQALHTAFLDFDQDATASVAILHGTNGTFCAGADLKSMSNPLTTDGIGPMGPTRMQLSKPVIAAIEGFAVAGGLELALWCDMRVAATDATLGVFCRRFGVPLIDGGSLRLPRLIGMSHAMDLILTGRAVGAEEALQMGLVNRVAEPGKALEAALALAEQLADFPQTCLRNDRLSAYQQWNLSEADALTNEFRLGTQTLATGEASSGAARFQKGTGRHGEFDT